MCVWVCVGVCVRERLYQRYCEYIIGIWNVFTKTNNCMDICNMDIWMYIHMDIYS